MKINKDTLPKLTLKDLKIIGAICLMVLVVIISFGFIGKGCGGGEGDRSKAETSIEEENIPANTQANETNRSNLNVNVKMNIKAGKYYYLEIYLEGAEENKFAKTLNEGAPTATASFYATPGDQAIYAVLYEADSAGNKTGESPIGSDKETVTISNLSEDVNAYLTINIDEENDTTFNFALSHVIVNASANSAAVIAIEKESGVPDYKSKEFKASLRFSAQDSEDGDCCANGSSCEVSVSLNCEDSAITEAKFVNENIDGVETNDNKCEGLISIPSPGTAFYDSDDIYNCQIEIIVTDSGKTGVQDLDSKYYVPATATLRKKLDLQKDIFILKEVL